MAGEGLDVATWIVLVGVVVMWIVVPALIVEHDRRKRLRERFVMQDSPRSGPG